MKNQKGYTLNELIISVLVLVGIVGWVLNIIALVDLVSDNTVTRMAVIRLVGVFCIPFGSVLGFVPA